MTEPSFSIGIEEEYLLVDLETLSLAPAPDALMAACKAELDRQVSPEFLQCQIEVGTVVCADIAEARTDLAHLRRTIKAAAAEYGLAPLAVSTHPFSKWDDQAFTDRKRYRELEDDLEHVARRMLICGMHVHVGIEDEDLRIDLMNQASYFMPHLLALSTSSPFWEGHDTGLSSYRLSVFDNMPRTGLPPRFHSFAAYRRTVETIIRTGDIEDATKIWWDLRPSDSYPTLETRICDISPRMEDALTLAALIQSLMRALSDLRRSNRQWRSYDRFLMEENRWRAQRYGSTDSLIDLGIETLVPVTELVEELIEFVEPHADVLGCLAEVEAARTLAQAGTSADRQRIVHGAAVKAGASEEEALRAVVEMLMAEFSEGL